MKCIRCLASLSLFALIVNAVGAPAASEKTGTGIEGVWQGTLKPPNAQLRVVFNISKNADGKLAATMDSPDQHSYGIPVSYISFKNGTLHLQSKQVHGVYTGKLSKDGNELVGDWVQTGTLPLNLKRTAASVKKSELPKQIYACDVCHIGRDRPGDCPVCGTKLIKWKEFMCPKCGPKSQADKAGSCATCKSLTESTSKVAAAHLQVCPSCKTIIGGGQSRPCPVCAKTKRKSAKS